jgi:hypothetical protein
MFKYLWFTQKMNVVKLSKEFSLSRWKFVKMPALCRRIEVVWTWTISVNRYIIYLPMKVKVNFNKPFLLSHQLVNKIWTLVSQCVWYLTIENSWLSKIDDVTISFAYYFSQISYNIIGLIKVNWHSKKYFSGNTAAKNGKKWN